MWQAIVNQAPDWESGKMFLFLTVVGVFAGFFVCVAGLILDAVAAAWKRKF
jgi:hypothetical protein